jgi:hypothetical protein
MRMKKRSTHHRANHSARLTWNPAGGERGDRDAASSATLPRTRHVAFERLVRIVNVVCCFSFSTPAGR